VTLVFQEHPDSRDAPVPPVPQGKKENQGDQYRDHRDPKEHLDPPVNLDAQVLAPRQRI